MFCPIKFIINCVSVSITCADPESFARRGPTLTTTFLVDEGRKDPTYHHKRAIIGLPEK